MKVLVDNFIAAMEALLGGGIVPLDNMGAWFVQPPAQSIIVRKMSLEVKNMNMELDEDHIIQEIVYSNPKIFLQKDGDTKSQIIFGQRSNRRITNMEDPKQSTWQASNS